MNEGKGRRKRRSAFVAARKQIRRGEAEEGGKERERVDKGAAGNKRLANPSCQFNLASNPGEMLIRASLPFLPSLLAALYPRAPFASLSLARASASASARAGNDTLFSRKDTAAAADDHVEIVCKASCTRRFSFSSPALLSFALVLSFFLYLSPPQQRSLSAFHPRNLSRLCRGICTNRDKGSREEGKIVALERTLAMLSSRFDHPMHEQLASVPSSSLRANAGNAAAFEDSEMKRSRREMQRQKRARTNRFSERIGSLKKADDFFRFLSRRRNVEKGL